MAQGVPFKGIRMTRLRREALALNPNLSVEELSNIRSSIPFDLVKAFDGTAPAYTYVPAEPVKVETDEEIEQRLTDRFDTISVLTEACIMGDARSLIVSGPAGLGKSYTIQAALEAWDTENKFHTIIKGNVRATGIYKLMYQYRNKGNVIVFDDSDGIFHDEISLNLLKAVCDTTNTRRLSWLTEAMLIDEETGERVPRTFDFEGTVIFITNLSFDDMIMRGHKIAPHLSALISRSHYIDCGMKTKRDYIVRIKQVIGQGMLNDLTEDQKNDVLDYIDNNKDNLRELSLRMALKIGSIRKSSSNWMKLCNVTCCK